MAAAAKLVGDRDAALGRVTAAHPLDGPLNGFCVFPLFKGGPVVFALHERDHGVRPPARKLFRLELVFDELLRASHVRGAHAATAATRTNGFQSTRARAMRGPCIGPAIGATATARFDGRPELGLAARAPDAARRRRHGLANSSRRLTSGSPVGS